jgi:SulP family sulfate permease
VAVVLFVLNYSRTHVIRHALTSAHVQSNVMRPNLYQQLFRQRGDSFYILQLQGFIFFGNAHRLVGQIKERINDAQLPTLRFLLLDFRLVTGVDPSATLSFCKLKQLAQDQQVQLVFTHLALDIQTRWEKELFADEPRENWLIFPDLDQGMAWCEAQMIEIFTGIGLVAKPKTLVQHLDEMMSSCADDEPEWSDFLKPKPKESPLMPMLRQYLQRMEVEEGQILIREGEKTGQLYFIEEGQVTAQANIDGRMRVLRILETGTVFGEINLYVQQKATATIVTSQPGVIYALSAENLQRMEIECPNLAMAFHRFIAGVLGEKLIQTDRMVRALQR